MKSTGWKDIAELFGIAAIVASLIFVGLQMKQFQEIAIAAQYHNRAALAVDNYNAQLESGILRFWGLFGGQDAPTELSADDLGRFYIAGITYLMQADNHFFQYQSGFMEEEAWQAQHATRKRVLSSPASPVRVALSSSLAPLRKSFIGPFSIPSEISFDKPLRVLECDCPPFSRLHCACPAYA